MSDLSKQQRLSSHNVGDSELDHSAQEVKTSVLAVAVILTLGFSFAEFVGGVISNSLALIGDAGHMLTDSASLLFALVANWLSRSGADRHHSFGHARIEVLAAFINALAMFVVIGWVFYEAVERFQNPPAVAGGNVILIASIGLIVNLGVAWSLSRDRDNVNTRAALVHVLGDLLGSIAAIIAGTVIYLGGSTIIDPILSILIGCLVLKAAWGVLKDTIHILLDGVPRGMKYEDVGDAIAHVEGVEAVHDLHVWSMSPNQYSITAHVTIDTYQHWPVILDCIRKTVKERFGIDHVTLQPEWEHEEKA
ncbi:MAG: cation transporter [Burkholderiaceae bacterium]|nr:cation transporter [Burkholderiaceae bacterium]